MTTGSRRHTMTKRTSSDGCRPMSLTFGIRLRRQPHLPGLSVVRAPISNRNNIEIKNSRNSFKTKGNV